MCVECYGHTYISITSCGVIFVMSLIGPSFVLLRHGHMQKELAGFLDLRENGRRIGDRHDTGRLASKVAYRKFICMIR